jgi:enoyl-CoA hydratase/carnithine racemase
MTGLRADDEMPLNQPQTLHLEKVDQTLLVTLARPEARNALDVTMMSELRSLWGSLPADVRCIVITGDGPGFCAGADMSLLESDRDDAAASAAEELSFLPGAHVDVPVIAAVNGVCAGGGLHFVADADIAIASAEATFIDPHVSVGQVTALEPLTLRLRMRPDVLARMVLLGRHERLDAERALAAGLVSETVDPGDLRARALQLAAQIAANSPAAVRRSRAVLRDFEHELLERHLERGWDGIRAHWDHPDAKEGPQAFVERRQPNWRAD